MESANHPMRIVEWNSKCRDLRSVKYSPGVLAVTKEEVLQAGRDQLVLDPILCVIRSFACLGESEGFEGQWIFINFLIHVDRMSGSGKIGTLGNERAV
jgi:hypothetical protein